MLGVDAPIDSGDGKLTPLFYYLNYENDFETPYLERSISLATSELAMALEWGQAPRYGIRSAIGWISHGAYKHYDHQGNLLAGQTLHGYKGEMELAAIFKFQSEILSSVKLIPQYFAYKKNEDLTQIPLSKDHFALSLLWKTEQKKISLSHGDMLKQGWTHKLELSASKRFNYYGLDTDKDESYQNSFKVFYTGELFQEIVPALHLELRGNIGWQYKVDRNNAEFMGSWIADHGIIPGYYFLEFQNNMFASLSGGTAFLLGSKYKLTPLFHTLFMPKETEIPGVENYPSNHYMSASLALDGKIMDLIPFHLAYAYGFDAKRKEGLGSHEIRFYLVGGFGDEPKKQE